LAVADPTRQLSYNRLTATAAALKKVIEESTSRQQVGIMLPATAAFPAALYGALWAGKTVVPLNFLLAADELADVVVDAGLDTIISIHHFGDLLSRLPAQAVALEDLHLKRRVLAASLLPKPAPPKVDLDQTAVILYTSGTSGVPKGVELTYGNLQSNCDDLVEAVHLDHHDRMLNILPPFHVFGLTACVLMPVRVGASVFAIPRFQPASAVKAIHEEKVTILLGIPSMYNAIARLKSVPDNAFASVKLAMSGGEPLPATVADRFEERFGVKLRQGYGLTETSPVISLCTVEATKDGSVGQLVRSVECRIADDDGNALAAGEEGEIQVKAPSVMKGYYNRPDDTAAVLDADGWFHTGDIGRFDNEGYLYITGRKKEMMIVGGENVFPAEIESVLAQHPGVAEAAVIGVPHESRGEVPVAFVILNESGKDENVDAKAIRAFARKRLASHKVPRSVHVAEDLPRGPTGKVLKRELARLLDDSEVGPELASGSG
jgi:long-chain acyl-CoA synthetase